MTNPLVKDVLADFLEIGLEDATPTRRQQCCRHVTLLCQTFGHLPVEELKPVAYLKWLKEQTTWRSGYTRSNATKVLKAAFNWAVRHDLIARNPLRHVTVPTGEGRRAMTDAEYRGVSRAASVFFRRVLFFLRHTGCRPGEMASARWKHVDFDRGVVVLPSHKTAKKTGKPRVIILTPVLVRLLRFLWRQRPAELHREALRRGGFAAPPPDEREAEEFVFLSARGGRWKSSALANRFIRLRRDLGLPASTTTYGLRHAFATRAALQGLNLKATATLLGHVNPHTTARYYTHLEGETDMLRDAATQVMQQRKPT
jgi:integrase